MSDAMAVEEKRKREPMENFMVSLMMDAKNVSV
jgi:hypothetical protein